MVTLEHYEGFTDSKKLVYLEENKPVYEQIKIDYDLALVFANGRQVDKYYEPKKNDLIVIRSVAGEMSTIGLITLGVSVIAGVVAGISAYKSNAELKKLETEIEASTSSSRNIIKAPYLKGASNTLATGQTQPFIIGTHLFTPYILNSGKNENYRGFTTIDGSDGTKSFYNIVLEGGFNNQIIQKVFADDTELVTLGGSAPQNKDYSLNKSGVFDSANNFIEIVQDGSGFKRFDDMNKVIVEKKLNALLNKKPAKASDDGTDKDNYKDLIYSLEKNSMAADVIVLINGLCHFEADGTKKPSTRNLILKYSPDYNKLLAQGDTNADANATWYDFDQFEQNSNIVDTVTTYRSAVYKQVVTRLYNLSDDYIKYLAFDSTSHYAWEYVSGDTDNSLRYGADSYVIEITNRTQSGLTHWFEVTIKAYKQTIQTETKTITYSNAITRNTLTQLRFKAHKDFTLNDVKNNDYPIAIKLSSNDRQSSEGQDYNDVYLDFIKSYICDEDELKNNILTNAKVIDDKSAGLSTVIGLHIEATELNEEKLKSIQVITSGLAKTWNGSAWSSTKTVTSNPASWLLEVLTSDKHTPSKVDLSEIDEASLGAWYEYCNTNGLTVNYVITSGVTKQSILELICNAGHGVLYRNIYGKIAVGIDGEKTNAQGILNEQNLVSFEYTKEMKREPDGLNIEYIDADAGYQKNNFVVMYNQYDEDGNLDVFGKNRSADSIILSQKLEGVTTWDNAIKHARYLMKCQRLRPKTCKAVVGMEGQYYVPMTKFLVQHPSLKIGLGNAEIESIIYNSDGTKIIGLKLYEAVTLDTKHTFNVVIQCVGTSNGVDYCTPLSVEIKTFNGRTDEIAFKTAINKTSNVIPHPNDVISYGYGVETVTSPMLLSGIENNGNSFTLSLVDYNADIFANDTVIPEYKPNITQPQKPVNENYEVIKVSDLLAKVEETSAEVQNINIPVVLKLYKRATTRPSTTGITSAAEYDYSTGALTWVTESGANGWTTTEPDGTDPMYITSVTFSGNGVYTVNANAWASPVIYVKNGNDGQNSAEVFNIIPSYNIVTKYANGRLSSEKIKFNFYKATESAYGETSVYYKIYVNESIGVWTLLTTGTGLNVEVEVNDYLGLKCEIYADATKTIPLDTETVPVVNEGSGAITVSLSNGTVTIPCDEDGNPKTLDGTNTLVYVLCGATPLNYGDASVTGNFNIDVEYENISVNSRSRDIDVIDDYKDELEEEYYDEDGNIYLAVSYFELPNITGISAEKGVRKIIVKGTSYDNNEFELSINQLFTKIEAGRDGLDGKDGTNGADGKDGQDGKDGNSVYLVSIEYATSTTVETVPTEWTEERPTTITQGAYIWTRRIYHDDKTNTDNAEYSYTYEAKDGKSIENVAEFYLTTNASSGVTRSTSGWSQTVQTPSKTKKYLWNYEKIEVEGGSPIYTDPVIIGNYAADGSDGNGISSVTEYYATSKTKTQPTNITETNINNLTFNSEYKYLWNKTVTKYTKSTDNTVVRLIGVYGDSGTNGYNMATVVLYQRSATKPTKKPTANLIYTFAKPPVIAWGSSGSSNGWVYDKPAINDNKDPLYEIRSTALSNTTTDTIAPSEWSNIEITQLDNGLTQSEVEALIETSEENIKESLVPVFEISVDGNAFQTNAYNIITKEQSINARLSCNRNGVELPFKVTGVTVPDGFIYLIDGETVKITAKIGALITNGVFNISVRCSDYTLINYTDETNEEYEDGNNNIYSLVNFSADDIFTHDFIISYSSVKGGKNYNAISDVSNIPNNAIIGDYFTYTGTTTESNKALMNVFKKGVVYQFTGLFWEEETDGEHLSNSLSNVLSVLDEEIENNNSKAVDYLDKLTTNDIFAKKVVAKLVESELIVSKETITNKFESYDNDLDSLAKRQEDAESNIDNILEDYLTSNDISDMETKTELAQTLQNYVTGNTLSQTLASYVTENDLENKGYLTDEEEAQKIINALSSSSTKTIIDGGLIKTGLIINDVTMSALVETTEIKAITGRITKIESDYVKTETLEADYTKTTELESKYATIETLESNYASIEYLEGGDATFKGDVKANSLELLNTLNINDGALTIDPDGTLNGTKGRFSAGLGKNEFISREYYANCILKTSSSASLITIYVENSRFNVGRSLIGVFFVTKSISATTESYEVTQLFLKSTATIEDYNETVEGITITSKQIKYTLKFPAYMSLVSNEVILY